MSKALEGVLELLLAEDFDKAHSQFHQHIVSRSRDIYESIESDEEVTDVDVEGEVEELDEAKDGVDYTGDFTDEISNNSDDIEADEVNNGQAEYVDDEYIDGEDEGEVDEDDEDDDDDGESIDDRVEDLESQLEALRAEFNTLMGEELDEPGHEDLLGKIEDATDDIDVDGGDELEKFDFETEVKAPAMYEKKKTEKLEVAPQAKKAKKDKKVAESEGEYSHVSDTGMHGKAKYSGTGDRSKLGAEQTKSPLSTSPSKKDFGGKPIKISSTVGGEPGKYTGEKEKSLPKYTNQRPATKKVTNGATSQAKFTGGASAGEGDTKSLFTKKPQ